MNESMIGGLVRHLLTTAGGALVAKGVIAATAVEPIIGGLMALFGVAWSLWRKKKDGAA